VLGALAVALGAPRVFTGYLELPSALTAAWLLLAVCAARDPFPELRRSRGLRLALPFAAAAALVPLWVLQTTGPMPHLLERRGFFGVLRVVSAEESMVLMHGRTVHGLQMLAPALRQQPTTYYGPASGVGRAIAEHPRRVRGEPMRVGVVGLGVGTLCAWAQPGDVYRFYEIDPLVIELARGAGGYFTYLSQCAGTAEIVLGDGRVQLEEELSRPEQFDVLALDAFSSDAIPAHLLTREAFAVYQRHLRDDESVLAVHISNRFLDLVPVVASHAAAQGLTATLVQNRYFGATREAASASSAAWVLLARAPHADWASDGSPAAPGGEAWTDDHVDLLSALK
jgi:hypothetical protein